MHFVITFGFSIPIDSDTRVKNASKGKVKRQKKRKMSKDTSEDTASPKNILNVGEILAEIHVEYELLPNYNFKFDCRCWETAAKIYTENHDWCLKSIPCPIKEKTCWIIFSVHHLVYLNEIQLRKFFNYVIVFHIFHGRQKLSERAKQDKVKGFYIGDDFFNVKEEEFLEIHPLNSTSKLSIRPLPEPTTISHEDYGDFSITTYLEAIPDRVHEYYFRKMLRKNCFPPVTLNYEVLVSPTQQETSTSSKRSNKHESKKSKKKSSKKSKGSSSTESFEIHLPAEVLFSDIGTITSYQQTVCHNISSILIYAQCENILSDKEVRKNLNPISIKLERLSNLPIDIIRENGFKCLYAKILFANRTFITPCYIPDETMCLEFIKCSLCEEFQSEEMINFLNTQFLTVEIIGVQNVDDGVSKVLLGITEFDVSDLLRGFWEVRLTNALVHPRSIFPAPIDADVETEEISWKNSPLTADVLTLYGTVVKIRVCLAYDLRVLQKKILRRENVLNRIFLNLNDAKLATEIANDVTNYNSSLLNIQSSNGNGDSKASSLLSHVLTGFVIQDCERFYIFLEGLSNGYLLKIWEKVAKLPIQEKCIYYNSNYVFVTRFYEDFIALGGIVYIKLSKCLEVQLRNRKFHIGETKTTSQATTVRKLGLINLALTMRSLCQTRLFPDPNDIKEFIDNICKTTKSINDKEMNHE